MHSTIRVLVADDHDLFRKVICRTLSSEADLRVVGDARDGGEALRLAQELHPDVVLMDVAMPRVTGLEATREIRRCCPGVKVIGLSMNPPEDMGERMRRAGASAYVQKGELLTDLFATIRSISSTEGEAAPGQ